MYYHKRNLPHYYPADALLFVTWRLFGSLPAHLIQRKAGEDPGAAFVRQDRFLDRATSGPRWLQQPEIANIMAEALRIGEFERGLYERHAWAIMPNHVHVAMTCLSDPSRIMRWIKGSSARAANLLLDRTGQPFWQSESYDRCIRNAEELNRIIKYVEANPVKAGLTQSIEEWPWSSASAGGNACSTI